MLITDLASLGDLAREMKINKSKLTYYVKIGILTPISRVGKTNLYERNKTLKRLKQIERIRTRQGATLSEIVVNMKSK